eukprot:c11645_g1_i1.p1 GENE.c11645_g1_i1~~c11645_g1_i1.p1  ORF type:complete len:855 (+),score=220.13 c11645_g1_i1:98-2662(+)
MSEDSTTASLLRRIGFSEVKVGECIGLGTYKTVYEALFEGKRVALLKMRQNQSIDVEASLLASLGQHPRLATFFGITQHPDGDMCLISELAKFGSLDVVLEKNPASVPVLLTIALQICEGMEKVASEQFVHRDLAARNCLVFEFHPKAIANVDVRVADFGMTQKIQPHQTSPSSRASKKIPESTPATTPDAKPPLNGAPPSTMQQQNSPPAAPEVPDPSKVTDGVDGAFPVRWMPPESFKFNEWSEKSDVWAFGVTTWEIFSQGAVPYSLYEDDADVRNAVENGVRLARPDMCPKSVYNLIKDCWKSRPQDRPTFSQLRQRLWDMVVESMQQTPRGSFNASSSTNAIATATNNATATPRRSSRRSTTDDDEQIEDSSNNSRITDPTTVQQQQQQQQQADDDEQQRKAERRRKRRLEQQQRQMLQDEQLARELAEREQQADQLERIREQIHSAAVERARAVEEENIRVEQQREAELTEIHRRIELVRRMVLWENGISFITQDVDNGGDSNTDSENVRRRQPTLISYDEEDGVRLLQYASQVLLGPNQDMRPKRYRAVEGFAPIREGFAQRLPKPSMFPTKRKTYFLRLYPTHLIAYRTLVVQGQLEARISSVSCEYELLDCESFLAPDPADANRLLFLLYYTSGDLIQFSPVHSNSELQNNSGNKSEEEQWCQALVAAIRNYAGHFQSPVVSDENESTDRIDGISTQPTQDPENNSELVDESRPNDAPTNSRIRLVEFSGTHPEEDTNATTTSDPHEVADQQSFTAPQTTPHGETHSVDQTTANDDALAQTLQPSETNLPTTPSSTVQQDPPVPPSQTQHSSLGDTDTNPSQPRNPSDTVEPEHQNESEVLDRNE